MHQLFHNLTLLEKIKGKTAIVTGSARGIGGATVELLNSHGCNVIIADLPALHRDAEVLIQSLKFPDNALFIPASVIEWVEMVSVFKEGAARFGKIDIVVANAGIMESKIALDVEINEKGDPLESIEASRVIDVNLKGALNTLRLGFHYMRNNPTDGDGSRGSIVLVASTSGYFGTTGNAAYIASKHGVVGLLRASQPKAKALAIRVNAIAPSFTPTHITAGFGNSFENIGVETNTPSMVGEAIIQAAVDGGRYGTCCLVAGKFVRELEYTQKEVMPDWLGSDLVDSLAQFSAILTDIGGYKMPPAGKI